MYPYCFSEFDELKKVLLCPPQFMTSRQVIHDPENQFKNVKGHVKLALEQHQELIDVLNQHDVETILLPHHKEYPEQTFVRDIGFTLHHTLYVAQMAHDVRKGEENILKFWLEDKGISYYNLVGDQIEGGDILIDRDTVYIGLSNRTNKAAMNHMNIILNNFKVKSIPFNETFLHLDCVFNVLSPEVALIYPEALTQEDIKFLSSRYELIEVPYEEQLALATNVLSIGNKKVISHPTNKNVNKQMQEKGFEVIEVDFSEIIKSGGSFRCCTLPLIRENSSS